MKAYPLTLGLLALPFAIATTGHSADAAPTPPAVPTGPMAPAVLPGRGMDQHPFLYTGEWDHRKKDQTLYVVRNGRVAWSYSIPINDASGTPLLHKAQNGVDNQ
jgi:hypothetical protein